MSDISLAVFDASSITSLLSSAEWSTYSSLIDTNTIIVLNKQDLLPSVPQVCGACMQCWYRHHRVVLPSLFSVGGYSIRD